ncbi:ribokinase [Austwickia chelonae NBRC 105200]|uniref:Ribokinase n=1 Tax=Austwickia chelonae NBRC 105200 TaxID=1184607 RepID=K6VTF0_9MICO|nr:ribokinase [Austwickia chelonae NBRC 105200]
MSVLPGTDGDGEQDGRCGRVLVLGSLNVDLFARVDRHPAPGETVLGRGGESRPGGKGANQAVAAALAGARVSMVGAVGDDAHAEVALGGLHRSGCETAAVRRVPGPTGLALITVSADGENSIIVVPGANHSVDEADLTAVDSLEPGDILVVQGEIPVSTAAEAVRRAHAARVRTVVNLAPVVPFPADVLRTADPLIVNEHEGRGAAELLGLELGDAEVSPEEIVTALVAAGVSSVVMTLGGRGALLHRADGPQDTPVNVPAPKVDVVDTTGAGDAFVGAFVARLAAGDEASTAAAAATEFAAGAVTREGAQDSYPGWDRRDGAVATNTPAGA